jgi:hypothetical protein
MSNHIYRSSQEPERGGLSWEETWRGPDKGLIKCWEVGRELSKREPELATRARDGELPILLINRSKPKSAVRVGDGELPTLPTSKRKSKSATRDEDDELPIRLWKGGVGKITKKKQMYGTLNYLAAWQGLRGNDLNINLSEEREIVCKRTKVRVIFTADISKFAKS